MDWVPEFYCIFLYSASHHYYLPPWARPLILTSYFDFDFKNDLNLWPWSQSKSKDNKMWQQSTIYGTWVLLYFSALGKPSQPYYLLLRAKHLLLTSYFDFYCKNNLDLWLWSQSKLKDNKMWQQNTTYGISLFDLLTFDLLDLQSQPSQDQGQPSCPKSRLMVKPIKR